MALHALVILARYPDGVTSAFVAASVNTHAVFLRRVLRHLIDAGLVEAREGRGGGYRLARAPERITLAKVYHLMEPEGPLAPNPASPNPLCPVSCGMPAAFAATATHALRGLESALKRQTVADLARTALHGGRPASRASR